MCADFKYIQLLLTIITILQEINTYWVCTVSERYIQKDSGVGMPSIRDVPVPIQPVATDTKNT